MAVEAIPSFCVGRRPFLRQVLSTWGAIIASCLLVGLAFWPLISHLGSAVLLQPGDASSTARDYWAIAHQHGSPFSLTRDLYLNAPEGIQRAPALQIANAFEPLVVLALSGFGFLAAINLFMLIGYVASLAAMFALLRYLRLHFIACIAGAIGFSLSQWSVEQGLYGHVAFSHTWIFSLLLCSLLWARKAPAKRSAVVGALLAIAFYVSSYFGLIACGLVLIFLIGLAGTVRVPSGHSRKIVHWLVPGLLAFAILVAPVVFAPFIAPTPNLGLPPGSVHDLYGSSLRDFVLPSNHNALYHRVFGVSGVSGEDVLFPGLAMCLAVVAGFLGARRKTYPEDIQVVRRFAIVVIPVAILLSFPAYAEIGTHSIPLPDPALVLGSAIHWWRVYSRFGLLAILGVVILGAIGLDHLLRSHRRAARTLAVVLAVVAVLEVIPISGVPTTRLGKTPVTRWLHAHPGGTVAFYPLAPAEDPRTETPVWQNFVWGTLYRQVEYQHPLLALPSLDLISSRTDEARMAVTDLAAPETPHLLAAFGVRYVIVDEKVARQIATPILGVAAGLIPVAKLGGVRIFRVIANVRAQDLADLALAYGGSPAPEFVKNFYGPETYDGLPARWMGQDGYVRFGVSPGREFVTYNIKFNAFSNSGPRLVTVTRGSQTVASFRVGAKESKHEFLTRLPSGASTLHWHSQPGPQILGASDPRSTSIYLIGLSATAAEVHLPPSQPEEEPN